MQTKGSSWFPPSDALMQALKDFQYYGKLPPDPEAREDVLRVAQVLAEFEFKDGPTVH